MNYQKFTNKLSSLATSYSDDTVKSMEIVMHFQSFFDMLLRFENKYLISCDSYKLKDILDEADIVKRKLHHIEKNSGDVLQIISTHYPLFYKELEFDVTSDIIEKYLNILYTIVYIYDNNSVSFNTYKEMGIFVMKLIFELTNEFLRDEDDSLDKLMENIHLDR